MGHRLSRIYTRTGDSGETGLGDGTRVSKDSLRIEALGCVDELNSHIGLILTDAVDDNIRDCLVRIQHDLFDLGGELCIPGHSMLGEERIAALETALDEYNQSLPPLKEFILPGGSRAAAQAHVARTICRRAERSLFRLQRQETIGVTGPRYLNRLSDLLFVIARTLNRSAGTPDVLWRRRQSPAD